jgi:N-dimethylarginine dimethylaminohydrolase
MSLVNVHNEWDPVEEIIVGNALYAAMPNSDMGFQLTRRFKGKVRNKIVITQQIIEETEEDIENFMSMLRKLNIVVKRPDPIKFQSKIKTLDWETEHYFCYCPRDILLSIGDMIIECPSVFRSRYFESYSYKKILIEYMNSGAKWISAPKPRLQDQTYNDLDFDRSVLNNLEPVFDAANVLRAGKDLFYLVSDSGNELGCQWLQSILVDKYRVHPCRNLYSSIHIDTTICLLRPGLLLANPQWVTKEKLPKILQKWDIIFSPPMVEAHYSEIEPLSSPWLGMNMLMLSPSLALVDKNQINLIKLLERHGIEVLPCLLRHGRVLGGGPHCITLDVRRTGVLEDYFS